MAKKVLNLTFPKKKIKEPLIYNLGHNYNVVTNIIKANVTCDYGWVLLELDGSVEDIKKAEDHLRSLDVIVEDVGED